MNKIKRDVCLSFSIDTNRINSRGSLENMNRLEKWHGDGVIHIEMSKIAQNEASMGGVASYKKANEYVFTETIATSPDEQKTLREIRAILFPDGVKNKNKENDVEIVFNADKYGTILITNDGGSKRQPGGIIGNKEKLATIGIRVMTDYEAVQKVIENIHLRDNRAKLNTNQFGHDLPDWVGKD